MKNLTKRIGAIALAASMVMTMMLSASAATYSLTLTLSGENAKGVQKTVTATSGMLGDNDSLAATVSQLVGSQTTTAQKDNHTGHGSDGVCNSSCGLYQLWSKELDVLFDAGKGEFGTGDNQDAWTAWVDDVPGYEGSGELVTWLKDLDATVGETVGANSGTTYSMTYTAESGKEYVLTVVATKRGTSGGGSTPSTPSTPDKPTTEVVTNPDGSTTTTTTDKSGNKTEVIQQTNGVTATTKTDVYGKYETTVTIPAAAASGDKAVTLPVEGKTQFTVETTTAVEVEIPVQNVTPGTVAVVVKADGTEEVVQATKMTETGVAIELEEGATLKVVDNGKTFTDMSGHWSSNAVAYVTARNMFSGTGNGSTFSPEVHMTRAMLAQVIYNLEGAEDHDHNHGFTDIDANAWYSKAVNWAAKNGVVSGYGDGSYQPDKELTREEVAQIFYNYAKSKGYDMSHSAELDHFVDDHEVSDWAMIAKKWAVGAGLISGKGGNVLGAKHNATRAEGAQMFMNFCQNIAQ